MIVDYMIMASFFLSFQNSHAARMDLDFRVAKMVSRRNRFAHPGQSPGRPATFPSVSSILSFELKGHDQYLFVVTTTLLVLLL